MFTACQIMMPIVRILSVCYITELIFLARFALSFEADSFNYMTGDCSWCVHVVNQSQLHCEAVAEVVDQDKLLITNKVLTSASNLAARKPLTQEEYLSFPYALRVQVLCDGKISYNVARHLAATGTVPKVSIHHATHGDTHGTLGHVLHGALVDLKQLELNSDVECTSTVTDTECLEDLCLPAWVVPLPFDNQTHSLSVDVSSEGFGQLPQSQRYTIRITRFMVDLITGDSEGRMTMNVNDLEQWQLQSPMVDDNTPVVLNGPPNSSVLLFSRDQLDTISILGVDLPRNTAVCEGSNDEEPVILGCFGLADRILLRTTVGLLEMRGLTEHVSVLPVCVKSLVSNLQEKDSDITVLAIEETDQIHFAAIDEDEITTFTPLTDSNQMTLCSYMAYVEDVDDRNCTVVSAAIDPTTSDHYLFLLKISNSEVPYYFLAEYSGNTSYAAWSKLSELSSAKFTFPTQEGVDAFLQWSGMSYTALVSQHLFIWGNSLIQSTDNGKTLHMMTSYPVHSMSTITAFTSSRKGVYAFLNQLQEVWCGYVGDFQRVMKLVPSSTWSLLSTLHHGDYGSDQYNSTTLTLFFDNHQQLYQLLAYQGVNESDVHIVRHPIPVTDIIAAENYLQREEAFTDDTTDSQHCPFFEIQWEALSSQYYNRIQKFVYQPPCLATNKQVYDVDALLVYQGVVYQVLNYHINNLQVYADIYYDPLQAWRQSRLSLQDYHTYLYRNHLSLSPVFVSLDQYYKMYEEDFIANELPERVYLDRDMTYDITIRVSLGDSKNPTSAELLENSQLEIDVSDYSLIQVITQRQSYHINNSVTYQISLQSSDRDSDAVSQFLPRPVTVMLQIWNSALKCVSDTHAGKQIPGTKTMTVMIGCPVGRHLIFDLQKSIHYLTKVSEIQHDCPVPDPQLPCIYYGNAFYPHFYIQDQATGHRQLFTNNYTFEIIAGGTSQSNMKHYTAREIEHYNSIDMKSNSLIWISKNASQVSSRTVFNFSTKAIHWNCQAYSPCADVPLNFPYGPEFYFLVQVSNRDVDSSTYCQYTTQFVLKVHGFRPSFHTSFTIVAATMGVLVAYILLYFACKHNDTWKEFKRRFQKHRISPEEIPPSSECSSEEVLHVDEPSPSVTFSEHIHSSDAWYPGRQSSHISAHTDHSIASGSLHKSILKKRLSVDDHPKQFSDDDESTL